MRLTLRAIAAMKLSEAGEQAVESEVQTLYRVNSMVATNSKEQNKGPMRRNVNSLDERIRSGKRDCLEVTLSS
jgi:hypothetical protein